MRRLLSIIVFAMLIYSANCFAQNTSPKHYYDYSQGFDGWAISFFAFNFYEQKTSVGIDDFFPILNKKAKDKLTLQLVKNNSPFSVMGNNSYYKP